jgi:hypothetical protein
MITPLEVWETLPVSCDVVGANPSELLDVRVLGELAEFQDDGRVGPQDGLANPDPSPNPTCTRIDRGSYQVSDRKRACTTRASSRERRFRPQQARPSGATVSRFFPNPNYAQR